ncbi:AlbA family DNA-binding domain-containing protein [Streptomyces sennicomposti]|uniref:AlbA family DNA-binding domain-containing protein n=1 Tax=Streptomyces sennicomposti TaxID=2873384 RepID=UPI001CA6F101|nr:ATP-binding protein [Streptomyces sennicomposti]MBY8864519.1 ATP-binding protein [Streptomyces sennicomposti]
MARSWTRLHEHLGAPPGPLTFDMVKQAADASLSESDDLDWKEQLPQPPRDGRWNELAKDVAAMANTRGGLLIYGVTDKTTQLVGIYPGKVNAQQYAQWVRNHVQPYLPDLTFTTLTSPDGATSVLVIDVPPSHMAPHHVYGTAAKDKDQQAAVVPYRDRDHTAWRPSTRSNAPTATASPASSTQRRKSSASSTSQRKPSSRRAIPRPGLLPSLARNAPCRAPHPDSNGKRPAMSARAPTLAPSD